MNVISIILAAVVTEAITEIAMNSELIARPREWLRGRGWFFRQLLNCGWCFSVWVGAAVFLAFYFGYGIYLYPFLIQRISNYLHILYGIGRRTRWSAPRSPGA